MDVNKIGSEIRQLLMVASTFRSGDQFSMKLLLGVDEMPSPSKGNLQVDLANIKSDLKQIR